MHIVKIAMRSAVLSAAVVLSAYDASAAPAPVGTNVNLRQGPGTTYTVITTIPAGANVDVIGCTGQWCQVTWQGQTGYVIGSSLAQGGPPPGDAPIPVNPGAPPPGYGYPPPGYVLPPPYYGPYPYYGYRYYYGGWYHRRWW